MDLVGIRLNISGDEAKARTYIWQAKSQLNILHHQMSFQNLKQGVRRLQLSADTWLECLSCFGQDTIRIMSLPDVVEASIISVSDVITLTADENQQYWKRESDLRPFHLTASGGVPPYTFESSINTSGGYFSDITDSTANWTFGNYSCLYDELINPSSVETTIYCKTKVRVTDSIIATDRIGNASEPLLLQTFLDIAVPGNVAVRFETSVRPPNPYEWANKYVMPGARPSGVGYDSTYYRTPSMSDPGSQYLAYLTYKGYTDQVEYSEPDPVIGNLDSMGCVPLSDLMSLSVAFPVSESSSTNISVRVYDCRGDRLYPYYDGEDSIFIKCVVLAVRPGWIATSST